MRRQRFRGFVTLLLISFVISYPRSLAAQQPAAAPPSQVQTHFQSGIYLVFPFESVSTSPRYEWVGEGLEELTIQRLASAGQQVYSHEGRLNELDLYGLPSTARLSRASMLHFAQEMDADFVIFGSFTTDGKTLAVDARILRVDAATLLPQLQETGPLDTLIDLQTKLVWRLLVSNDHSYPLSFSEFSQRQRTLRLDAFEQYARGLLASDDATRIRYLKEAARLEPDWPDPTFAVGSIYYSRDDCASALPWFARVPPTSERSVEALFATAGCRLRLGQADKAEELFTALQSGLQRNMVSAADVPEILNNVGLARAHLANYSAAQTAIARASDIDPDEDDYPFNLGLLSLLQNEFAAAAAHFAEAARRESENGEDRAFLIYALDKAGKKSEADTARSAAIADFGEKGLPSLHLDSNSSPLPKFERVKRNLDITALRLDLQDPNAQHSVAADASTPERNSPAAHIQQGRQELNAGRLDAAEQQFRTAIAVDPNNATAHRELAEIDRRRGKLDDAVRELQLSLAARDSAAARTLLARIYLDQKKPDLARMELDKAVKLAPNYAQAKDLLQHMDKSKATGGAQ